MLLTGRKYELCNTNAAYITNNSYSNNPIIRSNNVCYRKYRKTINNNRKNSICYDRTRLNRRL